MRKTEYNDLRSRAEQIIHTCTRRKTIPSHDVSQLIDELTLYQVELEVQNEDLLKSQAELEVSRSKYIELYDLAPVGYISLNKDGLIKEVNQAGCQLLGLNKIALINRCFSRYIVADLQTLFAQYRKQAFKELCKQSYELKLLRWNQLSFYALIECKAVINLQTNHQQLLMFITDISDRKLAEDNLHQQRIKMASIDRLRSFNESIYAIAQDQSNPLTIIDNYLQGCVRRLETNKYQPDELLTVLKKTIHQSRVLADIIQNRKNFSSRSTLRYERADLNLIISQTISLLTHELVDYPVIIQYEATDDLPLVKLDKFHIQHTILNIARNAVEAMRDGDTREPKLLIETVQTNLNTIEVTMSNNGPCLNQELIPKLFEPHFTTKLYGIGLGLTVSRAIIEKHGGELFAQSNPSGGASFGFTLPCVHAADLAPNM